MPVVSFVVQGVDSPRPVDEVERRSAFWFRNGHMYSYSYSHRLLADVCRLDNVKDGVVPVSILHYNTGRSMGAGVLREVLVLYYL
ncbi:unnamed protein product [Penicillium roqueforti FM164]|uniref:Genomic scaffold, ProqFM164S01 n=1 Tax=Penicillium roqueforti (strain FM164) TaxID=1365484 RepID=W6PTQ5_PENRF|nr:unnamed protein product [Penicillium roqueforti FM164]